MKIKAMQTEFDLTSTHIASVLAAEHVCLCVWKSACWHGTQRQRIRYAQKYSKPLPVLSIRPVHHLLRQALNLLCILFFLAENEAIPFTENSLSYCQLEYLSARNPHPVPRPPLATVIAPNACRQSGKSTLSTQAKAIVMQCSQLSLSLSLSYPFPSSTIPPALTPLSVSHPPLCLCALADCRIQLINCI